MLDIKFSELIKNSKKTIEGSNPYKIAVLGDCATQHLSTAIKGYAYKENVAVIVFDADYNQIDAQLMDEQSETYEIQPDFIVIYMCSEKLYDSFCEVSQEEKKFFADRRIEKIRQYWSLINQNCKCSIIQFNFAQADDRVFGNFANKTEDSFLYQARKLNFLLMQEGMRVKNAFIIDLDSIQSVYGRKQVYDAKLYAIAKMPVVTNFLPELAKEIISVISAVKGRVKKCIVLDLDNTLWGGVIGDDGMEKIQIGELGEGQAFTFFQRWLKEHKRRGIILAVCSKNNEETAKEPFVKHPEMELRLEDISMFVANWEDKASNIRYIQETLNIGMDSIVFLDDNPFERNLVKSMIPEITVPELPEDPSLYVDYLKELNLFETASYSEADSDRTRQYQEEVGRIEVQKQFSSYGEYLENLDMKAHVNAFDGFHQSRIAQLSQRSNQFNLRTVRYTEEEVKALSESNEHITLYFTLKDKYGDHGLISIVVMDKVSEDTLFISQWLMSCRVLKRGMEEFIIDTVVHRAIEEGFTKVEGEYIKTPKNSMVADIYKRMGFEQIREGYFAVETGEYCFHKTYISKD